MFAAAFGLARAATDGGSVMCNAVFSGIAFVFLLVTWAWYIGGVAKIGQEHTYNEETKTFDMAGKIQCMMLQSNDKTQEVGKVVFKMGVGCIRVIAASAVELIATIVAVMVPKPLKVPEHAKQMAKVLGDGGDATRVVSSV